MSLSEVYMDWEPESMEITSRSVEKILEPIVYQVSLLVNHKGPSSKKKGQSKQSETILKAIQDMIQDFLSKGEEIMLEASERQRDFRAALHDLEKSGNDSCRTTEEFLKDSCNIEKRKAMINAMKAMLSSVTRLMILADIVDVYVLLRAANRVLADVEEVKDSPDLQKLSINWNSCSKSVNELIGLVSTRQNDLIDDRKRTQMAAGRGILARQIPLLLPATKVYIRHPEVTTAGVVRDYVVKSIYDAIDLISTSVKGSGTKKALFYENPGEIATALENFDKLVVIKTNKYTDADETALATKLDRIVNDCAVLVSSPCTRKDNKQAIVTEGKNAKKNVQNLISAYKACGSGSSSDNELRESQSKMLKSTEKFRVNLKAAVADHISDSFIDTVEPLKMLVKAAKAGNEDNLESIIPYFSNTVAKMIEVANLACAVSLNYDGVKMVRLSANQMEQLYPQVVNSARVLVLRSSSEVVLENMKTFQAIFSSSIFILSDAVDNITNIREYLSVLDSHIAEDAQLCISTGKPECQDDFLQNVAVLRNRAMRACETVHGEMEGFRNSEYRNRVEDCLREIENQIMPNFDKFVVTCRDKLKKKEKLDENQLREGCEEVYDGIHDLWQAVVMGRDQKGYETDHGDTKEEVGQEDHIAQTENPKSEKAMMKMISGQHNPDIEQEMAGFFEQRKRLMHETTKWDESGNEIVSIAKTMCGLMMNMTDFTRGKGPFKSASDVIEAAGEISQCGNRLNEVLAKVIKECPSSNHKSDLEKYMERVSLYCHQLKMTSKVSADLQSIGDEVVVSGLETVTSLINSSKNLMSAVVETVKASYVATTKNKGSGQAGIQWHVRAPKKKRLVSQDMDHQDLQPMDVLDQYNQ